MNKQFIFYINNQSSKKKKKKIEYVLYYHKNINQLEDKIKHKIRNISANIKIIQFLVLRKNHLRLIMTVR